VGRFWDTESLVYSLRPVLKYVSPVYDTQAWQLLKVKHLSHYRSESCEL